MNRKPLGLVNRKPLARSRYTCHASVYSGSLLPSQFLNNTLTIPKLYNLGKPNLAPASLCNLWINLWGPAVQNQQ